LDEGAFFRDRDHVSEFAHAAHAAGNRIPYGVVAGRYCEAYSRWRFAKDSKDAESLNVANDLLSLDGMAVELGESVETKVELLRALLNSEQTSGAGAVRQLSRRSAYSARHLLRLGAEGWAGTPIN
jgi:hypothetical protein